MKQKTLILILSSIFILVIIWIILNIYHNSITSTISEALSIKIIPINPNFDSNTIEKLKNRKKVSPLFENTSITEENNVGTITPLPTTTPEQISPTITPYASPTIIQETQSPTP